MCSLSHLAAAAGERKRHLRGDGALPDAALAREDQDDVLDAGQLLSNSYKICGDSAVGCVGHGTCGLACLGLPPWVRLHKSAGLGILHTPLPCLPHR